MIRRPYSVALALGLCVAAAPLSPLSGQGILDRLENKVRERVERKTEEAVDKTVDKAANTAEHAVRCVVGEDACIKAAKAKGAPVVVTDTQGAPVTGRDSAAAIAQATQDTAPIAAPAAPAVPTGPAASTEPGPDSAEKTPLSSVRTPILTRPAA